MQDTEATIAKYVVDANLFWLETKFLGISKNPKTNIQDSHQKNKFKNV